MRYSGMLGIVEQTEVRPGIMEEIVTEIPKLGKVLQTTTTLDGSDSVLPKAGTTTSFEVPALGVGSLDTDMIRYITHKGQRWQITTIVDKPPMIVIYIGEVYNGPTPE